MEKLQNGNYRIHTIDNLGLALAVSNDKKSVNAYPIDQKYIYQEWVIKRVV